MLNENTTVTTTARKTHYNEAVQELCRKRKWQLTIKSSTDTTVADQADYDLPSDVREPGGLIEVLIGDQEYRPIEWNERLESKYTQEWTSGYWYTIYPEYDNRKVKFIPTPDTAGSTITFRHFFVPTRLTTLTDSFYLPDYVRRPIALLAAEFVSRAKRQHSTANNFRVLFDRASVVCIRSLRSIFLVLCDIVAVLSWLWLAESWQETGVSVSRSGGISGLESKTPTH